MCAQVWCDVVSILHPYWESSLVLNNYITNHKGKRKGGVASNAKDGWTTTNSKVDSLKHKRTLRQVSPKRQSDTKDKIPPQKHRMGTNTTT